MVILQADVCQPSVCFLSLLKSPAQHLFEDFSQCLLLCHVGSASDVSRGCSPSAGSAAPHCTGCHSDRQERFHFRNVALLQLKCILKQDHISSHSLCFIQEQAELLASTNKNQFEPAHSPADTQKSITMCCMCFPFPLGKRGQNTSPLSLTMCKTTLCLSAAFRTAPASKQAHKCHVTASPDVPCFVLIKGIPLWIPSILFTLMQKRHQVRFLKDS